VFVLFFFIYICDMSPLCRAGPGKPPANGKQDKGGPEKLDRRINRAITARHVRLVSNEGREF